MIRHGSLGKEGFALELDGTGDCVNVPNFTGVTGNSAFSVALWAKSTTNNTSSQQSIVSWGQNSAGLRATLSFDGGKFRLDNAGGASSTNNSFYDGNWHHVVAVKPANGNIGSIIFYVDGSAVAKTGTGGSTFNISSLQNFQIGGDITGANRINFTGTIDDFRLYNTEINASVASTLYSNGIGGLLHTNPSSHYCG